MSDERDDPTQVWGTQPGEWGAPSAGDRRPSGSYQPPPGAHQPPWGQAPPGGDAPPPGGYQPPPPGPGGFQPPPPGGYQQPPGGAPQFGHPYGGYGYGYVPARPTNSKATTAMVLGIVSLVMCWFLTGIPAIIVGNAAKREIAASGGVEDGEGMAKAGVIMGWIATVISLIGIAFYVVIIALAVSLGSRAEDRFEPLQPTGSDYCNDYDEYTWNDC